VGGEWPFWLAARLVEELCSLLNTTYPGFTRTHAGDVLAPLVMCTQQDCTGVLGSLAEVCDDALRQVADVSTKKCPVCQCRVLLRPYIGLAAGVATEDGADLEYWLKYLTSEGVDLKQVRESCNTLVDVLMRWSPSLPDVPPLWVPVPSDASGAPSTLRLRPVCAHPDCLHAVLAHTIEQDSVSVRGLASSTDHEEAVTFLQRVAQALGVFTRAQRSDLQTLTQHQLSQGVVQLRELVGSVSGERHNVACTLSEHTYVQALQDLYKLLGSPLEQVMEGESRQLFVCSHHHSAYTQRRQLSVRQLHALLQQQTRDLRGELHDVTRHVASGVTAVRRDVAVGVTAVRADVASEGAAVRRGVASGVTAVRGDVASGVTAVRADVASEGAAVRHGVASGVTAVRDDVASGFTAVRRDVASEGAAVRRDVAKEGSAVRHELHHVKRVLLNHAISYENRGKHPSLFVLLPSQNTRWDTLTARDKYHLYLLCEHEGNPHPVRARNGDLRRSTVPVSKKWLKKLRPIIRLTLFACKVAGIVVKGVGQLAGVAEETMKQLEYVCAVNVSSVVRVSLCRCGGSGSQKSSVNCSMMKAARN